MSDITSMDGELQVTLPDGSRRSYPVGTTVAQVAESIGSRLARAAVAARVDGQVVDLQRPLERDAEVAILTEKDPDALPVLRHSAAHILATAVRRLHPKAGIGFGPAIDDGFYYDFEVEEPFTPEELEKIEKEMEGSSARTTASISFSIFSSSSGVNGSSTSKS
jgi:threonyl-tRNA synthetase